MTGSTANSEELRYRLLALGPHVRPLELAKAHLVADMEETYLLRRLVWALPCQVDLRVIDAKYYLEAAEGDLQSDAKRNVLVTMIEVCCLQTLFDV